MGFYGQVMYEFTKMFSKFMVTQHSNSEIPITPPETPAPKHFEATTMWEQINIEPTNRWIQLDGEGGNDDIKTIKIGHGTPGLSDSKKTLISVEKVDSAPSEPTQLRNNEIIKVATLTHDAAGHANEAPSYSYYKLPAPSLTIVAPDDAEDEDDNNISSDTNDTLSFKGDGQWINLTNNGNALKIAHTTIASAEDMLTNELKALDCLSPTEELSVDDYLGMMRTEGKTEEEINTMNSTLSSLPDIKIIALEGGDLIKTHQSEADDNGHIIKNAPTYYKLPTTPSQISFDVHEGRIASLENRLKEGTLDNGTTYGDYEDIVNKVYKVGEQDKMYNMPAHQNITVTETIGKIDGENSVTSAINDLTGSTSDAITVSTAIQTLADEISQHETIIALILKELNIKL